MNKLALLIVVIFFSVIGYIVVCDIRAFMFTFVLFLPILWAEDDGIGKWADWFIEVTLITAWFLK